MSHESVRAAALLTALLFSAPSETAVVRGEAGPPALLDGRVLRRVRGTPVWHGGFGSAMARHPARTDLFYFLTDRGPNVDTGRENEKMFLLPSFTPRIGLFRRDGGRFRRVSEIALKDAGGRPLTGLPNPPGEGGTGERAIDVEGRERAPDPSGVDPEGLAVLPDGTFWIAEEYGPSLLHVDAQGRTLDRVTPFRKSTAGWRLPRVLASRRPNYGFEGLTVTPDGRALAAILQAPLDNPDPGVRAHARATRIVWIDLATGQTRQHVYLLDAPGLWNTDILALSPREMLVVERDVSFGGDPRRPARHKRLYRVDLAEASNVGDPEDGPRGRLFAGRTLEELSAADLEAARIRPAKRTLAADLLALPGGYPHDKPEGLVLWAPGLAGVVNDDDFGVTDDGGKLAVKILPGAGSAPDRNRVYFVPLLGPPP